MNERVGSRVPLRHLKGTNLEHSECTSRRERFAPQTEGLHLVPLAFDEGDSEVASSRKGPRSPATGPCSLWVRHLSGSDLSHDTGNPDQLMQPRARSQPLQRGSDHGELSR